MDTISSKRKKYDAISGYAYGEYFHIFINIFRETYILVRYSYFYQINHNIRIRDSNK